MTPRRLPNLTMHLIYGEAVGVVVGLLLAVEPEDVWKSSATILIASIIGGGLGFLIWWLRHSQAGQVQREKRILELRAQSRQRAETNTIRGGGS